ncbi:DUF6268 family outer membrane beta-barrel protein [Mangrovimonas sp. AS39]|uniref:DUF6268 family outer membrane beta-barrel protein n=1 Tax=Mangrovimonas futianensis TaxID=2895523 RepID=UPI001E3D0DC7|nr:DUF6268 family outer membrane beta-barrel protein [Mangrovimonas futianensis]MCF1193070.1 DUF6268 family outer membrane beta-barrel protein [Mangrovimonas futianensis]MCF1196761.1 DUF6268 family outer membrane beta-barrel protein [Mangrovimonas futianensis]
MPNRLLRHVLIFFLLFAIAFSAQAQLSDLARLEYSFVPKKESEDEYYRLRGLVNFPIRVKDKNFIVVGAEYNGVIMHLEDHYPFPKSELDRFHIIDFSLGYTFVNKKDWRFGGKIVPRIASTFSKPLTWEDFFINAGVYAVKDRMKDDTARKPNRLILGVTYNSTTGLPFPLPYVNYHRRFHPHWSYVLGVPKSNMKYHFDPQMDKDVLQLYVTLDGFYGHVQNKIMVYDKEAEYMSMSMVVTGLGYEHSFTDHLAFYIYTGYTLRQRTILRDKNNDEVFRLDDLNTFYFRGGLKYKI